MRAFVLLLTLTTPLAAQTPLHQQIAEIAKDAKGTVYVACSLPGIILDCDLNEHGHPPMQSVFKFPLAMAVLQHIEIGKFLLDQPVRFLKSDRSVTYSPLQDEFPEADVDVPLRKLIKLSVETSDNTATDIELRLIGGPTVLQQYLDSLGFTAIHQQDSEHTLHGDQKLQYRDYAEPTVMVALLRLLADHSPLKRWPTGSMGPDQGKAGTTEDVLLPRQNDANGHAANILAPGGTIWRMDKDGKQLSLFSAGYRNHFDAAFSPATLHNRAIWIMLLFGFFPLLAPQLGVIQSKQRHAHRGVNDLGLNAVAILILEPEGGIPHALGRGVETTLVVFG